MLVPRRFLRRVATAMAACLAWSAGLCVAQVDPTSAAPDAAPPPPPPRPPYVALLLPLDSPDFRTVAEAIQQGFLACIAAAPSRPRVEVRRTDASPARIVAEYEASLESGARVVVGPLTRSGVTAIAQSERVTVPTLALNHPDVRIVRPEQLYLFGLTVEPEARQVAQLAFADGVRNVAVVGTTSTLARRSAEAFADEWRALGRATADVIEVGADTNLVSLRQRVAASNPDGVFLATDVGDARRVRSFLPSQLPVYGTSQMNAGTTDRLANLDMSGVRFVDMPWLVRSADPTIAAYPRPQALGAQLARFYALGIDACRIALELYDGKRAIEFDGATGRINVGADGSVGRRGVTATFANGAIVLLE